MIDNHSVFHWLCEHYEGAELMAIQNGTRTRGELNLNFSSYSLQHYFCFGNYEKDLFSEYGCTIKNYYPVGSLLSGYYINSQMLNQSPIYDICVISPTVFYDAGSPCKCPLTTRQSFFAGLCGCIKHTCTDTLSVCALNYEYH